MNTTNQIPKLALVVPCYNEEEMIATTINALTGLLKDHINKNLIDQDSFMLLVNDGSKDNTWQLIHQNENQYVKALKLSKNVGHQHALLAGLTWVTNKVDCCISLDADLQDDLGAVTEMLEKYKQKNRIVYGVRDSRKADKLMKKGTAHAFYKLMKRMDVDLVYNHADFRLLDNIVLVELQKYKEVNLFLRGLFPLMGFTSAIVYYDRKKREAGESKYPFKKMLQLAVNGITSFSNFPLKLITRIGLVIFAGSLLISLWVFIVVIKGSNAPGWASITLPMYFLGGIQLMVLGIMGEYLGKIYLETKGRPRFHIEEEI
jgi:glycosyltransferase involved in cell wall biosynthesis